MRIAACIKYSLDVSEIRVDPAARQIQLAGVPRKLGNIDRNVLEAAVSLRTAHGGSVHVLTFGPPESKDGLKEALGIGADEVFLIPDPFAEALDPAATAAVLAAGIGKLGNIDLVICGEASDDGFTYQLPPRLAEKLGWPCVTYARNLSVQEGMLTADRDLGDRLERVQAPLPLVLTVTEESNKPRRPTLMDLLKAKKKPVGEWDLAALGLTPAALQSASGLELVSTQAVAGDRKQVLFKGAPAAALVEQLVDRLVADKVLEK